MEHLEAHARHLLREWYGITRLPASVDGQEPLFFLVEQVKNDLLTGFERLQTVMALMLTDPETEPHHER